MKTKTSPLKMAVLAAGCLIMIFVSQLFLVYDYINTTRKSYIRESNAILEEVFKKDLEIRSKQYRINDSIVDYKRVAVRDSVPMEEYDFRNKTDLPANEISLVELAINMTVSKNIPVQLSDLDSITGLILQNRNISGNYKIDYINTTNNSVLEDSKPNWPEFGLFQIRSNVLIIDIIGNRGLQLVLENPFGFIMQRMVILLISSVVFSILCLLAFRFLMKVLAQQKQLVAFKTEFLSTIAHELRRPVSRLEMSIDAISTMGEQLTPSQMKHLINDSVDATTELDETITQIITLSKAEEGLLKLNYSQVNIEKTLTELKSRFEYMSVKVVNITIQILTDKLLIKADEQLLKQCLANLTDNAIKYSGSTVDIIFLVRDEGNRLILSVSDNGLGIPEDKLPYIFEKYTQVHTEYKIYGYGIGLNYVKNIVNKHHGTIEAVSKEGVGSTFIICLPIK